MSEPRNLLMTMLHFSRFFPVLISLLSVHSAEASSFACATFSEATPGESQGGLVCVRSRVQGELTPDSSMEVYLKWNGSERLIWAPASYAIKRFWSDCSTTIINPEDCVPVPRVRTTIQVEKGPRIVFLSGGTELASDLSFGIGTAGALFIDESLFYFSAVLSEDAKGLQAQERQSASTFSLSCPYFA